MVRDVRRQRPVKRRIKMELKKRFVPLLIVFMVTTLGLYVAIWTARRVAELNRMTRTNKISFGLTFAFIFFSLAMTYFVFMFLVAGLAGGFIGVNGVMLVGMVVILLSYSTCYVLLTRAITERADHVLKMEERLGYEISALSAVLLPVVYLQSRINAALLVRQNRDEHSK